MNELPKSLREKLKVKREKAFDDFEMSPNTSLKGCLHIGYSTGCEDLFQTLLEMSDEFPKVEFDAFLKTIMAIPEFRSVSAPEDLARWAHSLQSAKVQALREEIHRLQIELVEVLCDESLTEQVQELEAKVKELESRCLDFENREGSVCPEDRSFEEVISKLQAENQRLKEALGKISTSRRDGLNPTAVRRIAREALGGE